MTMNRIEVIEKKKKKLESVSDQNRQTLPQFGFLFFPVWWVWCGVVLCCVVWCCRVSSFSLLFGSRVWMQREKRTEREEREREIQTQTQTRKRERERGNVVFVIKKSFLRFFEQ